MRGYAENMQLFHLLMLGLSVSIREHLTWSNSKIAVPESGCDVYLTSSDGGFIN